MTGADFLLPIAAGAAISWASYSVVAHAVSKQHISTLRATVWGALHSLIGAGRMRLFCCRC